MIFNKKQPILTPKSNHNDILIKTIDLTKIYDTGAVQVIGLKKINIEIKQKEFVAIMGQSGSGKSTLMNILGCLDRPSLGHYYLNGVDTGQLDSNSLSAIRNQKIGFVFQSYNLIPRTTAQKNVELPMIYAKVNPVKRRVRADELLAKVGLSDRAAHLPNELSGGQKQRVAIARALANEPPLILADEPTGNLDSSSSVDIMQLFTRLHKEGTTVIIVTHEEEIAAYCQRVIRFKDGQIISDQRREGGETIV